MATRKLKKTLEQLAKNANQTKREEKKYDPAKQAEGIETRLEASGVDVEKEKDKRSIFEKAFNLPDDQNILFDIFEVLGRPQQAVFGALEGASSGDGLLQGAKEGFTGNKKTQFKDVLNEWGVTEETEGSFGFDDVLGFAGDVFLDPMDFALFGAGSAVKGAKALDDANDALVAAQYGLEVAEGTKKARDGAKAVQAAEQAVNLGADLTKAQEQVKLAEGAVKDAAEALSKMSKKRRSAKQIAFQKAGSGFKGMMTMADTGIEASLKWLARDDIQKAMESFHNLDTMTETIDRADELSKAVKEGTEITKESLETIKEAKEFQSLMDRKTKELNIGLNTYRGIKETINNTFNVAKVLPKGLLDKVRSIRAKASFNQVQLNNELGETTKFIDKMAGEISILTGKPADEIQKALNLIYERGNVLFSADGKVTLKGMEQSASLSDIFKDKAYLEQMGVTKATKDQIDEFLEKYAKGWLDGLKDNTLAEGGLWHTTKGADGIQDTYRINNPHLRTSEGGGGLVEYFEDMTDDQVITPEGQTPIPQKDAVRMSALDEQIAGVETLRKNGKSIHPNNVEAIREAQIKETLFEDTKVKVQKAQDELERIDKIPYKKGKKAAQRAYLEAEQSMAVAAMEWDVFQKQNAVSNKTILKDLRLERAQLSAKYPYNDLILGKDVKKMLAEKFNIPHYLDESMISTLEEIAQLEQTQEVMAEMYAFTSKVQEGLVDIQQSGVRLTDGYLPHVLTPEWADKKINDYINPKSSADYILKQKDAQFIGNTSSMAGRTWKASAYESNRLSQNYIEYLKDGNLLSAEALKKIEGTKGLQIFEEDVRTSLIDMVDKTTSASADAQVFYETVLSAVFNPEGGIDEYSDHLRTISPGGKVPQGFSKVDVNDLNKKMDSLARFLDKEQGGTETASKVLTDFFKEHAGKEVYINKNLERLIRLSDRSQEPKHLLKAMDKINTMFKSNKLLSPGFQLRNVVGNISNMMMGGMPVNDVLKGMPSASRAISKGEKLLSRVAKGEVLNAKDAKLLENFVEFSKHGFVEYGNNLHDIPEHLLNVNRERTPLGKKLKKNREIKSHLESVEKGAEVLRKGATPEALSVQDILSSPVYAGDKLKQWNMKLNQQGDLTARMTLWQYAKDNPEWLIDNGYDTPEQAVRTILFEYDDLSVNEQDIMRKIIPFYTFTKKNLAFQIQNLGKNTTKYSQLMHSFDSMWGVLDLDAEERDNYKIENFWIPIPGIKDDGTYYSIKSSLPIGDLGEFLETPLQRAVSATAPVVRAPFELVMNKQAFSGMAISNYKGEKGFYIPEISKKSEYALSQLGLDVPAMAGMDAVRSVKNAVTGQSEGLLDTLNQAGGRTLVSEGNRNTTSERKAYDKLDNMQNSLRYYRERGFDIKTLAEINNKQKFKGTEHLIRTLKGMRR